MATVLLLRCAMLDLFILMTCCCMTLTSLTSSIFSCSTAECKSGYWHDRLG